MGLLSILKVDITLLTASRLRLSPGVLMKALLFLVDPDLKEQ